VYDYGAGKIDWLAHNLPVEGEHEALTVGRFAHDDVVRSRPDDSVGAVAKRIEESPYEFALVTTPGGVLLGRLPFNAAQNAGPEARVSEVMESGPSTVRPQRSVESTLERLAKQDLDWAIVTTPEGRLVGVASREELERAG
jgi:Mg/Co/Ni transporter MgtE